MFDEFEYNAEGRAVHWTDRPHTHGGTDCGGGEGCPAAAKEQKSTNRPRCPICNNSLDLEATVNAVIEAKCKVCNWEWSN